METFESHTESGGEHYPVEASPVEPPHWSNRARWSLIAAQVIGAIAVVSGAILIFNPTPLRSLSDVLRLGLGLTILPLGAGVVYLAYRTVHSAPDQLYQLKSIQTPRAWFFVIWGVGFLASLFLLGGSLSTIQPIWIVDTTLAALLMISGGLWALRWVSNKIDDEWPKGRVDAPPARPLQWPRGWSMGWAGLIGSFSTLVAGVSEVVLGLLVLPFVQPLLANTLRSSSDTLTVVRRLFSSPAFVLLLWVAVAIIAPMIEEACKALSLRLLRSQVQQPIGGLLIGVTAGFGFGAVESALYLSSLGSWLFMSWLRLSTLILHGIATGIVGVAYARSLHSGRKRDLLSGYARTVILHGAWNTVALAFSVGQLVPDGLLIVLISVAILLAAIRFIIPNTVTAGVQTIIQEEYQRADQPLPPEWAPMNYSMGWRLMGSRPIFVTPTMRAAPIELPQVKDAHIDRVEDDLKSM